MGLIIGDWRTNANCARVKVSIEVAEMIFAQKREGTQALDFLC